MKSLSKNAVKRNKNPAKINLPGYKIISKHPVFY